MCNSYRLSSKRSCRLHLAVLGAATLLCLLAAGGAQGAPPAPPALRLMLPAAHTGSVEALALGPDAELAATGGSDQRIHLWHLPSARQWRSLVGHSSGITTLAFNPDATLLASGDESGGVRVWRVADGAELCSWKNVDDRDAQLPSDQASRRVGWDDRGTLWAVGQRGLARKWRVAGCTESAATALNDGTVWDALPERNGWTIASQDALLRLDEQGKTIWRLPLETYPVSLHRRGKAGAVLLSDGRLLEFGADGRLAAAPPAQLYSSSGTSLAPLGDGWIATSGSRVLTRYRAGQEQEIAPLDSPAASDSRLSFSQVAVAGQKIVAAGEQGVVVLDARSFELRARLEVPPPLYQSVLAASAAGGRLLVGGLGDAVLWDLTSGRPLGTLRLPEEGSDIRAARFGAEGRTLLIVARSMERKAGDKLLHYSLESGRFLPAVTLPGSVFELALDAAGGRVFLATNSGILGYRADNLAPLGRLGSLSYAEYVDVDEVGTRLVAANGNEAELIDLADGRVLKRWEAGSATYEALGGSISGVRLGRPGDSVWFATATGVTAFDTLGARRWRTTLPTDFSRRLTLAPGGRTLLAAGQSATRLDAQTGQATALLLPVEAASACWLDARNALMLGADGAVRLWQSEPRPLLEWRSFARTGFDACTMNAGLCEEAPPWMVATGDGRFDLADFGYLPKLAWYDSRDPYRPLQFEWFARKAFTPRLLARTLAQGLPAGGGLSAGPVDPPRVKILSVSSASQPAGSVQVELAVEQGALPLSGLQLYRNGVRVARADARAIAAAPLRDGARIVRFQAVRLPHWQGSGPVRFEAWAFDSGSIRSSAAFAKHTPSPLVTGEWQPSRTWLVNIGVNRHENASFDLTYAANDARRMGAVLSKTLAANGGYQVVTVPLISDAGPAGLAAAGKARIREALLILSGSAPASADPGLAPLVRAAPGDRVVITFSGHGVRDSAGEFYLVPADTGPGEGRSADPALFAHAISSRELALWLDGMDADRVVLILDACHAAAAVDPTGFVPGPMDSAGLGQLAYDKGFAVLVATQADDVALESGRLQQGVLTYALIQDGLEAASADHAPADGWIGLIEWLRYGVKRVPGLARRIRSGDLPAAADSRGVKRWGLTGAPPAAQTPALFYFSRERIDERLLALPR